MLNIISLYRIIERLKKSPIVLLLWYIKGKSTPPPHIYKQKVIATLAKKFTTNTFIESGTYKGDMVYGMKNKFKKIISVELSNFYYKLAKERFKSYQHINIIKGDSEKEIKIILKKINEPCTFWLDGHYSSGKTAKGKTNTPIIQELQSILDHKIKSHVILIDDAREFNGKNDYPKIKNLKKMLQNSNYVLLIKNDIIRITPSF